MPRRCLTVAHSGPRSAPSMRPGVSWIRCQVAETQRCYRCKKERPLGAFTQRLDDRHYRMCRPCVSEIMAARTGKRERLAHTDTHRICYLCRRTLANAEFTQRSNGTFFSACKECNRHVFAQRRRARLQSSEGSYTTMEWQQVVSQYERCPMCHREWASIEPPPGRNSPITVDHIVPISQGGSNSIENIQPLCYSCNSKKGGRS